MNKKLAASKLWQVKFALFVAAMFIYGSLSQPAYAVQKHVRSRVKIESERTPRTNPPFISIDVQTGRVIASRDATRPWYPASVTKLMTVYVALRAVQDGRLSMDTPLVVSARAASMKPSKMGFAPGSQVTLSNALKMLMVKSANDIAITIAEGVSGSVETFAVEMNEAAVKLGMRESRFVNPNGLPDPNHVSSARDMALLGRALLVNFPQYAGLFDIGALKLGEQIIPTHNGLIGRYPGADGMKTGFTCPAGFNLVASASRDGRKVIVVVMGVSSARIRTAHAADLLDQAFAAQQVGEAAADLPSMGGEAPDMRMEICGRRSHKVLLAAESDDIAPRAEGNGAPSQSPPGRGAAIAALPRPDYKPVPVFLGAAEGYVGPVAGPRPANTPIGVIAYSAPEHVVAPSPLRSDPKALSMHQGSQTKHKVKTSAEKKISKPPMHGDAHNSSAHAKHTEQIPKAKNSVSRSAGSNN
jgi:D-alanyl-D-alanine carboxypeptidase